MALDAHEPVGRGEQLALGAESLQRRHPVEAAREELQQDAVVVALQALGDEGDERVRAGDEHAQVLGALRAVLGAGEPVQALLGIRVRGVADRCHHGTVEQPPAAFAGDVGDDRVAALGDVGDALEGVAHVRRQRVLVEAAVQDGECDRAGRGGPLLGDEQPVRGVLERGGAGEPVDPDVGQRAPERGGEVRRQALRLRVQRAQPGVEVLLRAALHGVLVGRLVPRAGQRLHVGVALQDVLRGRAGRPRVRGVGLRDRALGLGGGHVVAEQQPEGGIQRTVADRGGGREPDPARVVGAGRLVRERLDRDERRLGHHLHVGRRVERPDAPGERRDERALHLHALDDGDDVARLHLVADGDGEGDDDRGPRVADDAAVVAGDPVRRAVHLDEQVRVERRDEGADRPAPDRQAALVGAAVLDVDLDARAVDLDAVACGCGPGDGEAVVLAPVAQFDGAARRGVGRRASAARECAEAPPLVGRLLLGDLDRGLDQRRVGAVHGRGVGSEVGGRQLRRLAGEHRGVPGQREEEAEVRGAALDDDERLGERAAQAGERLGAARAPGGDRRQQRVVRAQLVALGDARVHPDERPGREPQQRQAPGRGAGEVGAQRRLEGVPAGLRRLGRRRAVADQQLRDVQAGRHLDDRGLGNESRIDGDHGRLVTGGQGHRGRAGEGAGRGGLRGGGDEPGGGIGGGGRGLRQQRAGVVAHHEVDDAERHDGAVAVAQDVHLDEPSGHGHGRGGGLGAPARLAGGADHRDAGGGAAVGDRCGIGAEAGADPDRVRRGLCEGCDDAGRVIRVDGERLVRLAHVERALVPGRVHRDELDRDAARRGVLAGGVDDPHRGGPAARDGDPARRHQLIASRIGARSSASGPPGSSIVR